MSKFIKFARKDVLEKINFPVDIFGVIGEYLGKEFVIITYLNILGINVSMALNDDVIFSIRGSSFTLHINPSSIGTSIFNQEDFVEYMLQNNELYMSSFFFSNILSRDISTYKLSYLNELLTKTEGKSFELILNIIYVVEKDLGIKKIKTFREGNFLLSESFCEKMKKRINSKDNFATKPYRPIFDDVKCCCQIF